MAWWTAARLAYQATGAPGAAASARARSSGRLPPESLPSSLSPKSYWRLNCALASYYELVTKERGYDLENKWTFLKECMAKGVPCSPCLDMKGLCIKHKNEEGGLGIHFFKNATKGGDWIIQVGREKKGGQM